MKDKSGLYDNSSRSTSSSGYNSPSQEYSEYYRVDKTMLKKDKLNPDVYDKEKGYFKNPTATKIENSAPNGKVKINGNIQDGRIEYVLDLDENIIIGIRANPINPSGPAPHPTLIGGLDPVVKCAGMIRFHEGKIIEVDISSGHYKPNESSKIVILKALKQLYKNHSYLFDKNWKWRIESWKK